MFIMAFMPSLQSIPACGNGPRGDVIWWASGPWLIVAASSAKCRHAVGHPTDFTPTRCRTAGGRGRLQGVFQRSNGGLLLARTVRL